MLIHTEQAGSFIGLIGYLLVLLLQMTVP